MRKFYLTNGYNSANDLLDSFFATQVKGLGFGAMATNVKKDENGYTLEVEVPGFKKEEISVSYEKEILTVSATKEVSEEQAKNYLSYESVNSQSRKYSFANIDENAITAKYENGVLTVNLPVKKELESVKRVVIE